jgi:predicted RecA/RadA family phage recombinase
MSEARYVGCDEQEFMTAPSGGYVAAQVVQCPSGRAGVIDQLKPAVEGDHCKAVTEGRYAFPAASGTTFSVGAEVGWNDTTRKAVAAADGDWKLGIAARAKTSGQLEVEVFLNLYVIPAE